MIQTPLQIEGTWEQIAALAENLSGYRLRLTVLAKLDETIPLPDSPQPLSEQFARIREQASNAWSDLPADLAEQHDHYIYGWEKK